jgi:hypothetical protein
MSRGCLSPEVLGPEVLWPKGLEDQRFVGRRLVEVRSRKVLSGTISGFCFADLLTA